LGCCFLRQQLPDQLIFGELVQHEPQHATGQLALLEDEAVEQQLNVDVHFSVDEHFGEDEHFDGGERFGDEES
jgi:hypothetical protein